MKLLLDECTPKEIKKHFSNFEIYTVHEMGWKGKLNGELLQLAFEKNFDVLITSDKNISYQQYLPNLKISIIILNSIRNRYQDILPLIPKCIDAIKEISFPEVILIN